eukprot:scaffold4868_cov416-Prasinococcus_capsulatus_cf.AAC.25
MIRREKCACKAGHKSTTFNGTLVRDEHKVQKRSAPSPTWMLLAPHNVYTSHKDYGEIDAEHRELMLPFINIDKELYAFGSKLLYLAPQPWAIKVRRMLAVVQLFLLSRAIPWAACWMQRLGIGSHQHLHPLSDTGYYTS